MLLCFWPSHASADRAKARALTLEGQNQAGQGFQEEALELYERAIGSDPDYYQSYELAIPLWMRFGKLSAAQSNLEALTLRCSDCAFGWYALGALYRKVGRFDLAVLAYEFYLAKRPSDADAYYGLAMALGAQKDKKTAAVLRRYLKLENRPDRAAFRKQARRLLVRLTGRDEQEPKKAAAHKSDGGDLATIAALIDNQQLLSAESLLNQRHQASAASMRMRAGIASARGQWFQEAGYLALAWLWR
jgi:tetratricopeptide (TPR) repeat protein